MADWYNTGEKADEVHQQELENQEKRRKQLQEDMIHRFWMPVGAEQHITFVDDLTHPNGYPLPFVFYEHQLHMNGSWKNWYTCPGDNCPLCKHGDRPSLVAAYTIIDHNEWTDKKGGVHKDEKKVLMAKPGVNKLLRKYANKKGGLRGWKVEVMRKGSDSPNTGDSFDFETRVELKSDMQPYNYIEIFAPKSIEELESVFGGDSHVNVDDETVTF